MPWIPSEGSSFKLRFLASNLFLLEPQKRHWLLLSLSDLLSKVFGKQKLRSEFKMKAKTQIKIKFKAEIEKKRLEGCMITNF